MKKTNTQDPFGASAKIQVYSTTGEPDKSEIDIAKPIPEVIENLESIEENFSESKKSSSLRQSISLASMMIDPTSSGVFTLSSNRYHDECSGERIHDECSGERIKEKIDYYKRKSVKSKKTKARRKKNKVAKKSRGKNR